MEKDEYAVPQEIIDKLKDFERQRSEVYKDWEEFLNKNELIWSFNKCKELKCKYTKGQRNQCGTVGCLHSRPLFRSFNCTDKYEPMEKPAKRNTKDVPMLNLTGKYVYCYNNYHGESRPHHTHPILKVEKETTCLLFLENGDKVNKREMSHFISTQWDSYGYRIRPATDEEIKRYSK